MKAYIKNNRLFIQKDGHTDAAAVMKSCKTIISHCEMIMENLTDPEANLPTWFTNKLAISEYEVVSAANYLADGDMDNSDG